jgi:hypothetical protein
MAVSKNGISGLFQGVAGGMEFYIAQGKQVVRARRKTSSVPPSQKQQTIRQKTALVSSFLRDMVPFVREGYSAISRNHYAYATAQSYLVKNAVTGEYPDCRIDYSKVLLTRGTLNNKVLNARVKLKDNKVIFSWTGDMSPQQYNDRLMALVYAPSLNQAVYILSGALRSAGGDRLTLPNETWLDTTLYAYMSFMSVETKECSDSVFFEIA